MRACMRVVPIVMLLAMLGGCGRTMLYANLDEHQANQVQGALLAVGIDADKRAADNKKGWTVEVSKHDFPRAVQLLKAQGIPAAPFESMGMVFKKEGFVSSPLEERARYLYAIAQELEYTLEQIDGVVKARVHIALPEADPIGDKNTSASASVVIIEGPDRSLRDRETDIKAIVTDAVEGLENVNKVTVKFFQREPGAAAITAVQDAPQAARSLSRDSMIAAVGAPLGVAGLGGAFWLWYGARRRRTADRADDGRRG